MKAIWKYRLPFHGLTQIEMPQGAKILRVGTQGGHPHIWALVDTETSEMKDRQFLLLGTGHTIKDEVIGFAKYIGSFEPDPQLIFHLFDMGEA